jgi:hypothetical protein
VLDVAARGLVADEHASGGVPNQIPPSPVGLSWSLRAFFTRSFWCWMYAIRTKCNRAQGVVPLDLTAGSRKTGRQRPRSARGVP